MRIFLFFVLSLTASAGIAHAAQASRKPQLPVEVRISPTQPGITQKTIEPGQTVEFALSTTALSDVTDVKIDITLQGGAELVAGEQQWSGPASKGETKEHIFTVRAPDTGTGRIRARVTYFSKGRPAMKRTAQFILGSGQDGEENDKPYRRKKDSRGRDIVEY